MAPDEPEKDVPASSTEGMVDNLVTQFSSALDCFRELVQNSIDAGTPRVDIWMEWEPGEGHQGTIAIHVEDFGEGMDERIIDEELTQLFASGKDEDLTKIGKFGIGFVSVFALEPRAVLVHTGRSGEFWEVLFHEDRSFSKTRVNNPIEGTQITIFIEGEYHRYQQLAEEIPETLRHWCSHSSVEVTFEDRFNNDDFAPPETINEEFEVDGECMQHVEHEGTQMVLAYNRRPIYGFYNRGLTLALTDVGDDVLGRWKRRLQHISFKMKSRYLEHTMARDSVIRDEQYERAMGLLKEAADGPLLDALFDRLEELAAADEWSVEDYHRYGRLMGFLAREPAAQLDRRDDRPVLRCLNGDPMTFDEAWEAFRDSDRLLVAPESSALIEQLGDAGVPVLLGHNRSDYDTGAELQSINKAIGRVLEHKVGESFQGMFWSAKFRIGQFLSGEQRRPTEREILRSLVAPATVYFPVTIDQKPDPTVAPLLDATRTLLEETIDVEVEDIATGTVEGASEAPFVMVSDEIGDLMARPSRDDFTSGDSVAVALNRNHPQFDVVFDLYERDTSMGTYMLARGLLLHHDFDVESEHRLFEESIADIKSRYSP